MPDKGLELVPVRTVDDLAVDALRRIARYQGQARLAWARQDARGAAHALHLWAAARAVQAAATKPGDR